MKPQIEKVKKLKTIILMYEDGSGIAVPEDKALSIGTAFMKIAAKEQFDWTVLKPTKESLKERIKKFFMI